MTYDGDQLNLFRSELEAAIGIYKASGNSQDWLVIARDVGERICKKSGWVTAAQIREVLYKYNCRPHHPNAWGGVFRDSRFKFTGLHVKSPVVKRHAGLIRVWDLA